MATYHHSHPHTQQTTTHQHFEQPSPEMLESEANVAGGNGGGGATKAANHHLVASNTPLINLSMAMGLGMGMGLHFGGGGPANTITKKV